MGNKKKKLIYCLGFIVIFSTLLTLFNKYYIDQPKKIKITMEVKAEKDTMFSVYYDLDGTRVWNEEKVDNEAYEKPNKYKKLSFFIPEDAENIRIDFGASSIDVSMKNLQFCLKGKLKYSGEELNNIISVSNDVQCKVNENLLDINCNGNDSSIYIYNLQELNMSIIGRPTYINYMLIALSLLLGYITIIALKGLKASIEFVKLSICNKSLIVSLAKNDFKQKYVSSYLGVIWGFIQPLITIAVYWFVFTVGFRNGDVGNNIPFIVWFVSGIVPWFFFTDSLTSCTNVFIEYSYLVKKVVFKIEALPVIKILSTLFVQCFFIIFLLIVSSVYGFYPDIYTLQVIYYLFAMIALIYSVTIFTSAVVLFFRDLSQIITIIVNIGFWATPIGWKITMLPDILQKLFKLNPMFYIVTGYRDSFVEKIFFWERPYHTLYFWCFCGVMLLIGTKVFNKLRPHFSDVI